MKLTAKDIKTIRSVYRLTAEEMALILGISRPYVHLMESEKKRITEQVISKYKREFDLTPEKLEKIEAVYREYSI